MPNVSPLALPDSPTTLTAQYCPPGATEQCNGLCRCTSKSQEIQGSGDNAKRGTKCPDGFSSYTTKCCPAGSTEVNGECQRTVGQQQPHGSGDNAQCVSKCPTGQTYGTRCGKNYLTKKDGQCVCSQAGYTDDGATKNSAIMEIAAQLDRVLTVTETA